MRVALAVIGVTAVGRERAGAGLYGRHRRDHLWSCETRPWRSRLPPVLRRWDNTTHHQRASQYGDFIASTALVAAHFPLRAAGGRTRNTAMTGHVNIYK